MIRIRLSLLVGILAILFFTAQVFAQSLTSEIADIVYSSEKGFEKLMEIQKIPLQPAHLQVVSQDGFVQPASGYFYENYTLQASGDEKSARIEEFRLHVRHPQMQRSDRPMPVVFMVAGIQTGAELLNLMPRQEGVIFVVFEYNVAKNDIFAAIKEVGPALTAAPRQISSALYWIQRQVWAEQGQLHAVGVSLGTIFIPIAVRVAEKYLSPVSSTALAYGGMDLSMFLNNELQGKVGHKEREWIVEAVSVGITPLDPTLNLPYLKGPLLFVNASNDEVIPRVAVDEMLSRAPKSKQVVVIEGGHINSDKWDIIVAFGAQLMDWYRSLGVID